MEPLDPSVIRRIRNHTLQNAFQFGKPDPKAIMGKVMAGNQEFRPLAREIMEKIREVCSEISELSRDEIVEELSIQAPELLEKKESKHPTDLHDLPNVTGNVMMRFAPGPSGPLHIGHSRAAILNDEYVKRYGGKFILRLEDTNPLKIMDSAYGMIAEDMGWLGTHVHETVIQSDRFGLYGEYAKKIIELGGGYICTCPVEKWRRLKVFNQACPHREFEIGEQLERWEGMQDGSYHEGEASLIIKTDLAHPNPAIRDFVAMRILEHPHPRTGDEHRVYPLYNFSVAIDDHLMMMTHVLRGKDHLNNTYKQKYVYRYFGWEEPEFIHYGWVSIPDTLLKTSSIREGIEAGEYSGWDDIRLGTFRALAKRGYRPEAIRRYWVEVGIKEVDIRFTWKNLIAYNKDIIDPVSPRYFFVADPLPMTITDVIELRGRAPLFPDRPEAGVRDVLLKNSGLGIPLLIPREDSGMLTEGETIRLKDLGNVRILKIGSKGIAAEYTGNDLSILKQGARNIHWCPEDGVETVVHMPDGNRVHGRTEAGILDSRSDTVQFERFAFVRIEKKVCEKSDGGTEKKVGEKGDGGTGEVKGEIIEGKNGDRGGKMVEAFFTHK